MPRYPQDGQQVGGRPIRNLGGGSRSARGKGRVGARGLHNATAAMRIQHAVFSLGIVYMHTYMLYMLLLLLLLSSSSLCVCAMQLCALQPWTFLATFTIILSYWLTLTMCQVLAKPFGQDTDTFNIDALIGGTEQTAFHNLRASFHQVREGAAAPFTKAKTKKV